MDFATTRREYLGKDISLLDLDESPFRQFGQWFADSKAAQLPDPTAMVLASVGSDMTPSQRIVLLKGFDYQGFVFFTNLDSRKAKDIKTSPRVSLLFPWHSLDRQVIVAGSAERLQPQADADYFQQRPRASQIAAWASPQSQPIETREWLMETVDARAAEFGDGKIPLPPFWGGYLVRPIRFEFWQGRENRLHDRFEYQLHGATWKARLLAP